MKYVSHLTTHCARAGFGAGSGSTGNKGGAQAVVSHITAHEWIHYVRSGVGFAFGNICQVWKLFDEE